MNHIGQDRMSRLAKQGLLDNSEKFESSTCEHCLKGKLTRKPDRMSRLAKQGLLGNSEKVELSTCEHCLKGKLTRKPFGKATRAEFPL